VARAKARPVSLAEATARARAGEDVSYLRVSAQGNFDHARERYLYAISGGEAGWHVIAPLTTAAGEVVLVDRGFVPETKKESTSRAEGQIAGDVTVVGLARPTENQGLFTPDNEARANRWFWRDLPAMSASMFPEAKVAVVPFYLEAERAEVPGGWPRGGETKLDIRNDHLQYALTWFLMAFCVAAIYAIWLRGRLRRDQDAGEVAGNGPES
jgi:surfeit locus 1 family protein